MGCVLKHNSSVWFLDFVKGLTDDNPANGLGRSAQCGLGAQRSFAVQHIRAETCAAAQYRVSAPRFGGGNIS